MKLRPHLAILPVWHCTHIHTDPYSASRNVSLVLHDCVTLFYHKTKWKNLIATLKGKRKVLFLCLGRRLHESKAMSGPGDKLNQAKASVLDSGGCRWGHGRPTMGLSLSSVHASCSTKKILPLTLLLHNSLSFPGHSGAVSSNTQHIRNILLQMF